MSIYERIMHRCAGRTRDFDLESETDTAVNRFNYSSFGNRGRGGTDSVFISVGIANYSVRVRGGINFHEIPQNVFLTN